MKNVEEIVRRCVACQKFANRQHAPASELKTIPLSWPFATLGLNMVGPLKKSSKGGRTHLLVAVDKFASPAPQPSRLSTSSSRSSSDSECHTTSSRTTARTSQPQSSRTSAKNWASKSIMHQSRTCSPTARWKKQTALYAEESRNGSSHHSSKPPATG